MEQAVTFRSDEIAHRYSVVGGDFFTSVPAHCDLYILRHIIHDWADDQAITILQNCRNAMCPGGKILIIELLLKDSNEPDFGRFMDLTMLTLVQGRERTISEYDALLNAANLRLSRVIPTKGLHTLIEAEAA
jgi:hypothetical protein